jgi:GNAT superfamily N-acetyltransferase
MMAGSKTADGARIRAAGPGDTDDIAEMVGELLEEIMASTGTRAFHFNFEETAKRLSDFLRREKYFAFVARDGGGLALGFVTLCEAYALYTEGVFGLIPELYVRPDYRSAGTGHLLSAQAKAFGRSRGWKRLEVTTPPLPQFGRTLAFYEREGFSISGGRKLKLSL